MWHRGWWRGEFTQWQPSARLGLPDGGVDLHATAWLFRSSLLTILARLRHTKHDCIYVQARNDAERRGVGHGGEREGVQSGKCSPNHLVDNVQRKASPACLPLEVMKERPGSVMLLFQNIGSAWICSCHDRAYQVGEYRHIHMIMMNDHNHNNGKKRHCQALLLTK